MDKFLYHGQDYRQFSPHAYAAAVFREIDVLAEERGGDPQQILALKLKLFMESGGQWDARPGIRSYSEADTQLPKYASVTFEKQEDGTYRIPETYVDEMGVSHADYRRVSGAYGAYQTVEDTLAGLKEKHPDVIDERLALTHPRNQASLGYTLQYDDDRVVVQSMKNRGSEQAKPYAVAGLAVPYLTHFAGAPRAAMALVSHEEDPNRPLGEIWPESVFAANPDMKLPEEMDPNQPHLREWTTAQLFDWVATYKYNEHMPNVAQAEAMNAQRAPETMMASMLNTINEGRQGAEFPESSLPRLTITRANLVAAAVAPSDAPKGIGTWAYEALFGADQPSTLLTTATGKEVAEIRRAEIGRLQDAMRRESPLMRFANAEELTAMAQETASINVVYPSGKDSYSVQELEFTTPEDGEAKARALGALLEQGGVVAGFMDSHKVEGVDASAMIVRMNQRVHFDSVPIDAQPKPPFSAQGVAEVTKQPHPDLPIAQNTPDLTEGIPLSFTEHAQDYMDKGTSIEALIQQASYEEVSPEDAQHGLKNVPVPTPNPRGAHL